MDDKGRVSLPSKFRARLTGEVWLVKGLDGCLWLFTQEGYDKFMANLYSREAFDDALRRARRFFSAGSEQLELDSAGRLRIPAVWRKHAGLEKTVTIAGLVDRIELWIRSVGLITTMSPTLSNFQRSCSQKDRFN